MYRPGQIRLSSKRFPLKMIMGVGLILSLLFYAIQGFENVDQFNEGERADQSPNDHLISQKKSSITKPPQQKQEITWASDQEQELDKEELPSLKAKVASLTQERDALLVQYAQAEEELKSLRELSHLAQVADRSPKYKFLFVELSQRRGAQGDQEFWACLVNEAERNDLKERQLVIAQGALLGEILKVTEACALLRMVTSEQSSYEIRLEKSGITGVAVGLGDRPGEEVSRARLTIKYLERTSPAVIGERALLFNYLQRSQTRPSKREPLPPLVLGEVIEATLEENGLFQSATLALPFRRDGVHWALVLVTP